MASDRDIEISLCVFREANDALFVFDPTDQRVVNLNPAAIRLTGFEKKSAFAMKIADLLSSPDPSAFHQLLEACQKTGFFHSKEGYELARSDAPPIPVNVSISRIHTRPDPLALATIRDISARKKAEDELKRARDELEARVQARTIELLQAKEVAEQAGRVKDRFLAALSHELRTPLTPVLAVVSALLDDPATSASLRPTLEMIRRSIALEARLIDDLLDLTRLEQRQLVLERRPIDAHALIDQALELCRGEVEAAEVQLRFESSAKAVIVESDPTRFLQVACNLIQNALKFVRPGGSIVVRTSDGLDGRLQISVIDDGRGIEPQELETIFEPFESVSSRQRNGSLGLSISRSIVEAHGGTLSASSEGFGKGATFRFDLPGARQTDRPRPESAPTSPGQDLPGYQLLLVEDNKDVLRYLKIVLEMRGHQVTTAVDLASAREALGRPFDLLISDIQLPDGTGLELVAELQGRVPAVAISGFGTTEDVRMSLGAGFARHLTKPVEIGQLDAAIRQVMAEAGKHSEQAGNA